MQEQSLPVVLTVTIRDENLRRLLAFMVGELRLKPFQLTPLLAAASELMRILGGQPLTIYAAPRSVDAELHISGIPEPLQAHDGILRALQTAQEETAPSSV